MERTKFSVCARVVCAMALLVLFAVSAVSADYLVASRDSYKVTRFTDAWGQAGNFITFPSGTRALGVAQDPDTLDVYVRITTSISDPVGKVLKYDWQGNLVSGWSVTGLSYARGLAVRNGKVFVPDPSSQTLKWYSTSDSSVWGSLSSGSDTMGAVDGMAFDSHGRLYVAAGATVKRWAADLSYMGIVVNTVNAIDVKIIPNDGGILVMRWDGYLLGWDMEGNWTGPYLYHAPPPWPQALLITSTDVLRTCAINGGVQKLDLGSGAWQLLASESWTGSYPMGFTRFVIPEPGSMLGLAAGLVGLVGLVRRRKS